VVNLSGFSNLLSNFVILAGDANAGKTTLLSSLYINFQREPSSFGYVFSGSRTLIGFEKLSFWSLISSNRKSADTERTKLSASEILHIQVANESDIWKTKDLLFYDISGERYKQLGNSITECRKFTLIERADHFVLFFDSNLLSDMRMRNDAKIIGINILRSLSDSGMLNPKTYIEVVFSKWDLLLLEKNNVELHKKFIEGIKNEVITRFSATHGNINFYEIASRPKGSSTLEFCYGVDKLFSQWVEESSQIIPGYLTLKGENVHTTREFSKF
jgi:hypothetical protein